MLWHLKWMGFQPKGIIIVESHLSNFQSMKVFEPTNMYVLFVNSTSIAHIKSIKQNFEKITFIQLNEGFKKFYILDVDEIDRKTAIACNVLGSLSSRLNMDKIDIFLVYINLSGREFNLCDTLRDLFSRAGILIVRIHLIFVNQSHSYLPNLILRLQKFNLQLLEIFGGKSLFYFQKDNDYDTIDLVFKNSDLCP